MLFREPIHKNEVQDVVFSPDGGLLLTAGGDGVLQTPANGGIPEPRPVSYPSMSGTPPPAGTRASPPTASPWARSAWRSPRTARGCWRAPARAARSPSGGCRIVSSCCGIQDTHGKTGGSANPILNSLAVTPDGRRIMTAGQSTVPIGQTKLKYGPLNVTMSEVRLWDIDTGRQVAELARGEDEGLGQAALSPDGTRVALADCGVLRILDAMTGKLERSIGVPGHFSGRVRFSPDGSLIALPINNSIGLFEVKTGRRLHHEPQSPVGSVLSAGWSPAGDRIVTGHEDGEVRVWEADAGKLVWHQVLAPAISQSGWNAAPAFVAISHDARRVMVAGRRDDPVEYRNGIVAVLEALRGIPVRRTFLREVRHAALSPDRKIIVAASSNGGADDTHLHGIDVETGRELYVAPPDEKGPGLWQMKSMRFRSDSRTLDLAWAMAMWSSTTASPARSRSGSWPTGVPPSRDGPTAPPSPISGRATSWRRRPDPRHLVRRVALRLGRRGRQAARGGSATPTSTVATSRSPHGKIIASSDLNYAGDEGRTGIRL